jgi:hypothetical protein
MKKIFTLFFITGIAASANAQQMTTSSLVNSKGVTPVVTTTPATPADDQLLVMKETEYDFGKIPQGKPVIHIFYVDDKSKDSLKIANVQASCGCTTPDWEKDKTIAPGGSTKITVGYNAAAEGPFTKFITITYNGAQTKQITIKGEVWKTPATSAPENKSVNDLKN